ncbi:MAG TPA: SOSS complex subunit B family protein, partial [Candidatus Nanoarchaeia archaeon]|nr:SOSS complex subunit B family protein [Candidatus Nanoarchaeia archaeon]
QGNVNLIADIVDKAEPRTFSKFGKDGRVANAILKDETGQVKLSLWNEQIEQVNKGDKVEIKNGYVGEWNGELQLSTGKFGTLAVVGAATLQAAQQATHNAHAAEKQPAKSFEEPAKEIDKDIDDSSVEEESVD